MVTLKEAFDGVQNDPEEVEYLTEEIKKYRIYDVLQKMPKNPKRAIKGSSVMDGSYFNLSRESMEQPCSTICQMHGQMGAAGSVHPLYDRKFTMAELRRITTIPDDFILTGTYQQQWERLGRMVPSVMMKHIAATIQTGILDRIPVEAAKTGV